MKTLEYRVTFTTPAFLGNAEQIGQWRTPPFKALLRQWWRVAYASHHGFEVNVGGMRREEGLLFGNAWLSHREGNREVVDHRKSLVRIRLDKWTQGEETKQSWGKQEVDKTKEGVSHPEVGSIGPLLYLGYGPLIVEKVKGSGGKPAYATVLKKNAAIQSGETARFAIAYPESESLLIEHALWLMSRYGTLGGRGRNGWGSFKLDPIGDNQGTSEEAPQRDWREALNLDWPHAIGRDERGPLIWQTQDGFPVWKEPMQRLAEIKIGLRTQFLFTSGPNARGPESRHWLSYPVTKHNVADWRGRGRGDYRLPNSLRFKVRPDLEGQLRGVIFHVPCLPPEQFHPDRRDIEAVWQRVHDFLDDRDQNLLRISH